MDRVKAYLDTNIILDAFLSQAKAFRAGTEFEKPKKLKFLISQANRIEFFTSFLTKAEVFRELLAAYTFDVPRAERMWNDFMDTLDAKRHIETFTFDSTLVDIVCRLRLRLRTLLNFFHLFIAIKEDAYFVTGDKDLIEKARQSNLYHKAVSYVEFRRLIGGDPSSGDAEP